MEQLRYKGVDRTDWAQETGQDCPIFSPELVK